MGTFGNPTLTMLAILSFSITMSTGPIAGEPVPSIMVAPRITMRLNGPAPSPGLRFGAGSGPPMTALMYSSPGAGRGASAACAPPRQDMMIQMQKRAMSGREMSTMRSAPARRRGVHAEPNECRRSYVAAHGPRGGTVRKLRRERRSRQYINRIRTYCDRNEHTGQNQTLAERRGVRIDELRQQRGKE